MSNKKQQIIFSTENLSVGYHTKKEKYPIVSDISITLKKGELIGLIGINGSGKSTLLRTLSGLQLPLSGKIMLDNQELSSIDSLELAKKMSVVLTKQQISKNLSVIELVSLGRQPYTNWLGTLSQTDHDSILEALTLTETVSLKYKKCYELSDGQLQRVLIARALAQDTDLILLDEPMSHLDLHHKAALLKLLTTIAHQQNKTVIYATHDIEYALNLCDQLIVIQKEKAIYNTPEELITSGILDTLFPSKHIIFDTVNKRFILN